MNTFIIIGAQGAGKSLIAQELMRSGQVQGVVEEWRPGQAVIEGWAHCTQYEPTAQATKEARVYITVRPDGRLLMRQEFGERLNAVYAWTTVEDALKRAIPTALFECRAYVQREAYLAGRECQ